MPHGAAGRHHDALHGPLTSRVMVGLSRYREVRGDVVSRLVVARYRNVLDGYPIWHAAISFTDGDGAIMPRSQWGRRELRLAARTADGLLAHHGEGDTVDGDGLPGLSTEVALHRVRRLRRAEMGCLPAGWLERPSIDLTESEELPSVDPAQLPEQVQRMLRAMEGHDAGRDPVGVSADDHLPVPGDPDRGVPTAHAGARAAGDPA